MCPICISTAALVVAGSTSAGGLSAFAVSKLFSGGKKPNQERSRHDKKSEKEP
jgi:hypothetical protein